MPPASRLLRSQRRLSVRRWQQASVEHDSPGHVASPNPHAAALAKTPAPRQLKTPLACKRPDRALALGIGVLGQAQAGRTKAAIAPVAPARFLSLSAPLAHSPTCFAPPPCAPAASHWPPAVLAALSSTSV